MLTIVGNTRTPPTETEKVDGIVLEYYEVDNSKLDPAINRAAAVTHWFAYKGLPQTSFTVSYVGIQMLSVDIMCVDEYAYQREFSLSFGWEPGQSRDEPREWRWSAYKHPFRPSGTGVLPNDEEAVRLVGRLIDLTEKYPSLVFNSGYMHNAGHGERYRPRCAEWVRFHEKLLWGWDLIPAFIESFDPEDLLDNEPDDEDDDTEPEWPGSDNEDWTQTRGDR